MDGSQDWHLTILLATLQRQSRTTMTSVSAGYIILTQTQPVGCGNPERRSNPPPLRQESRALPTELSHPPFPMQIDNQSFLATQILLTPPTLDLLGLGAFPLGLSILIESPSQPSSAAALDSNSPMFDIRSSSSWVRCSAIASSALACSRRSMILSSSSGFPAASCWSLGGAKKKETLIIAIHKDLNVLIIISVIHYFPRLYDNFIGKQKIE